MTAYNGGVSSDQSESIRVIQYNRKRADDAFEAHLAMLTTEMARPKLASNPAWVALRQDAFENFSLAFEEVGQ